MNRELGNLLIIAGAMLVFLGVWLRVGPAWPVFGRLPGDVVVHRGPVVVVIPVTSMILLSVLLTLIVRWLGRRP